MTWNMYNPLSSVFNHTSHILSNLPANLQLDWKWDAMQMHAVKLHFDPWWWPNEILKRFVLCHIKCITLQEGIESNSILCDLVDSNMTDVVVSASDRTPTDHPQHVYWPSHVYRTQKRAEIASYKLIGRSFFSSMFLEKLTRLMKKS